MQVVKKREKNHLKLKNVTESLDVAKVSLFNFAQRVLKSDRTGAFRKVLSEESKEAFPLCCFIDNSSNQQHIA